MKAQKRVSESERYQIGARITWITIVMNIVLAIGKILVGILGNSTAMLADGIHTVSDTMSSIGIIIGFFIAKKPEDSDHPYGHEKAESIAGFVLSLLLIAVGVKIGLSAIELLIDGERHVPGVIAAWAAGISIIGKEVQYRIAIYGGKKINSSALIADAWHHRSDALSSVGALLGIIGARMGYPFLDPVAGLVVSIIVVKVGIEVFIQGYNELMDTSIQQEMLYNLAEHIVEKTQVININEIRTRKHGSRIFVDIKVCIHPDITVTEGHDIAEEVERVAFENLENAKDVLVHVNPCRKTGVNQCTICEIETSKFLKGKVTGIR